MREEVEEDQSEEFRLPHLAFANRHAIAETRNGQARLVVAGADNRGMRGMPLGIATDSSGVTRRHTNTGIREKTPLAARERVAAAQAALAFPRSPPGSPAKVDYYV